jgi:hypothetical protein
MPTNSWCHVAVTLDGSQGLLYLDGAPIATNANLTIRPWQTGWQSAQDGVAETNSIGRSKFADDPLFSGRIESFRIFGRALSGAEIQSLAYAQPALAHRYSFTSNVWDSVGMAHGTLMGSATVTNGALVLDGTTGSYVNLPGGLVSDSSAVTLECWATFGVNGNYARVVDFGNISGTSGSQYFYFSPHTSSGSQHMEMKPKNTTTTFDVSGTLDNRTIHVVCILDPTNNYAAIYTNGALESSATIAWPKFTNVSSAWSFIGRSLFSADAYLNATIDELRLYDGRLSPTEIATDCQFGPNALTLPLSLVQSNTAGGGVSFSWPSYAVGFVLETTSALGSAWTNIIASPVLNNDRWQVTIPAANAAQFFRLRR